MDTSSFFVYIKTDGINKNVRFNKDGRNETRFDTTNYELERPLPNRKNKNIIELMKEEFDEKIMT